MRLFGKCRHEILDHVDRDGGVVRLVQVFVGEDGVPLALVDRIVELVQHTFELFFGLYRLKVDGVQVLFGVLGAIGTG